MIDNRARINRAVKITRGADRVQKIQNVGNEMSIKKWNGVARLND